MIQIEVGMDVFMGRGDGPFYYRLGMLLYGSNMLEANLGEHFADAEIGCLKCYLFLLESWNDRWHDEL